MPARFRRTSIECSWVPVRLAVDAELAVQSQQRRRDDGRRHSQLQPALSSAAGTDEWVLSWRLNETSDSSGDRRAVGSRFQVLEQYTAKLR